MANTIACQVCSKPATVHLTQIMNNKVEKLDLCEQCAKAKGVTDPQGFSLGGLFGKMHEIDPEQEASSMRCENCGWRPEDFREHGRFGCPACYQAFKGLLNKVLRTMHKGERHTGKAPLRALERMEKLRKFERLESALKRAVDEERYEDAATLRDELNSLQEASAVKSSQEDVC